MRVLVIGGTEFISLHLVRALLRDRHEVVVLNRGRQPERVPAGVKTIVADRKSARPPCNAAFCSAAPRMTSAA